MGDQSAADVAFGALGDPTRRELLRVLSDGPLAVNEIADALPVGRPAVSKHLRVLEGAGLVRHRTQGTRHLYALAPAGLVPLQQWLVETWDRSLGAFAAYAERHPQGTEGDRDG